VTIIDTRARALTDVFTASGQAVATDVRAAHAVFRAEGRGGEGVITSVQAGRHALTVDEPPTLGGGDEAANPVEHALAAIISCQVVTYRFWAARLGIPLDDVEVVAEGDLDVRGFFGLDAAVRPGFTGVRLAVTLRGPETAERYEELRRTVDAHCPVLDLFSNPTPVSSTLVSERPAEVSG
jgi:uncharacterized OsmC-like protein